MPLVLVPGDLGGPLEASQLPNRRICIDLPLLGGSHGVHRAAKLEVVEAARSNGERGRGGDCLPGGRSRGRGIGGGIALFNHRPSAPICTIELPPSPLRCTVVGVGDLASSLRWGCILHLRTEAFMPKARTAPEARTLDLASILTKRVSALETAGLVVEGGCSRGRCEVGGGWCWRQRPCCLVQIVQVC